MKGKVIAGIFIGIIMVIVMVQFLGASVSPLQSSMNGMNGAPCLAAGGYYNSTSELCQNGTVGPVEITNFTNYSMKSLFSNTGIVMIVILAAVLLVCLFVFMRYIRK